MTIQKALPNPADEPTISVERAAQLLGISRQSGYNAIAAGEIPSLRFGHRLVVPTARLLALLGHDGSDAVAAVAVGSDEASGAPARSV